MIERVIIALWSIAFSSLLTAGLGMTHILSGLVGGDHVKLAIEVVFFSLVIFLAIGLWYIVPQCLSKWQKCLGLIFPIVILVVLTC